MDYARICRVEKIMLVAWRAPVLRATRDIDLLARMSNDLDKIGSSHNLL